MHPIARIQSEYSVWERRIEENILPAARVLGIGLVPFSPLGRGFLAGPSQGAGELPATDFRHHIPRLDSENAPKNARIVAALSISQIGIGVACRRSRWRGCWRGE